MATKHFSFSNLFPIPKFLEIKPVGLDISDNAIRIIELQKNSVGFIPSKFGSRLLPHGVSLSSNREEIKKALISLKEEFDLSFIRASLPEEKGYLYKTEIPHVSSHDMAEAVSFTIEENAPVTLGDVVFDFKVMGGGEYKDKLNVVVSVLPRALVHEYIELFEEVGLTPISFEIEPQAIARAIIPQDDFGSYMLVHIADTKTNLSIVSGGAVQFTSTLPIGGNSLTSIIKEEFKVDDIEAHRIKKDKDFIRSKENTNVNRVFLETINLLKDEINKYYIYWFTHKNKEGGEADKINLIYLSGRDACIPGFSDYLGPNLKVPVKMGHVWQNCFNIEEYVPAIDRNEAYDYAGAIGLVLPK